MPDYLRRLVPALLAAFLALFFVCCDAERPDSAASRPDAPSDGVVTEAPDPLYADGERTLAVLLTLSDAQSPLHLSLDAAPGIIDGYSGVLTVCALGDDISCRLGSGSDEYGMLLTDGTAWVIQYGGKTYYRDGGETILALRERLRGLSAGAGYSFDCGETVYDAETYDYESFVDGGKSITMLFAPGTDELRCVIMDREPVTVLEFDDAIPDGSFELPEGFSEIYP